MPRKMVPSPIVRVGFRANREEPQLVRNSPYREVRITPMTQGGLIDWQFSIQAG